MTNDLTRGKPIKLIILFTLPVFIGNVFQQLYNMVDTIIVGQTIGSNALAGVGATGAIGFLIIGFVTGLTGGFSVMTSQCFGAKNENDVRRSVATSFMLCAALTVVLTLLTVVVMKPLLRLIRTPEDIFEYAYEYIVVICWGLGATIFYNMLNGIIRALGDSITPLIFLIIASIINVGLDFAFIVGAKMGVGGAAWATVISQLCAGLMCAVYMFARYKILRLHLADFKTSWNWIWRHLIIGLPMAFQFSITAIGVLIQQAAINSLGVTVVTAHSVANKIENLATQLLLSIGVAMATYVGQNYGAGEYERIHKGVNQGMIFGIISAIAAALCVIFLAKPLTKLFMKDITPEIIDLSRKFLFYQGINYIWLAAIFVYRNSLQGMGKGLITVIAGVIELIMRALAAFILVKSFGFMGVCLSNPVAWIGAAVFLVLAYYISIHFTFRKNRKANGEMLKV